MKKYLRSLLLLTVAIVSASMFVSCGEDETDDLNPGQKEPVDKVEMGRYDLQFDPLWIFEWPDSKEDINKQYEAYQKRIIDALKYEAGKKYKWSEIEAEKDRLKKIFNDFEDFEYVVRNCGNNFRSTGHDITFCAYKDGSVNPDITFGEKKLKCKLDVPENTTCQLMVTIKIMDVVPSAKEYCENVKKLYTDAIKDVFTDDYGKAETSDKFAHTEYYNLANRTDNSEEIQKHVNEACKGVQDLLPAIPEDVLKDAQAHTPAVGFLFSITIEAFNTYSARAKVVYGYEISIL